ncbi:MAG: ABC transporter substrate-binding protein [Candidatus Heimdallarchaeota archaeon]|nr:ABC transporter substrate-binding protein [Candidatus Heimdallarchaeota archaeon]
MRKFTSIIILIIISSSLHNLNTGTSLDTDQLGETITYALPYDFDEYSIFTADSYATDQWVGAVYGSLLKRSSTNHDWETDLAKIMPTISADGLTFSFTLKNDLRFSNGNMLNTTDVEFSFHVALTPAINRNFYDTVFFDTLADFLNNDSINIVNSNTVEFTLLKPFAFPYTLLSFPIVEKKFFETRFDRCLRGIEIDCLWNNADGLDAVSSGPFMIQSIDNIDEIVTLEANPYYYGAENMYTDNIVFKKIADKDIAIENLGNGKIDILDTNYWPGIDVFDELTGIREEFVTDLSHLELSLNHLNPYYGTGEAIPGNNLVTNQERYDDSLLVRKAMSHIVERTFAVEAIWEGLAKEAVTAMPASAIGFDETILHRNYSIDVARKYMEMAGFDYSTLGAEAENSTFERNFFEITMLAPSTAPARNQWHYNYALELPKIGIGVKEQVSTGWLEIIPRTFGYGDIENNPEFPLPPSYEDGGFDIFAVGYTWAIDWNPKSLYDASGRCDTGNCYNIYNFDINEDKTVVAALIRDYLGELDFEARIEKVKEVQQALYDNIPVLPVLHLQSHWGFNDNVVGIDSLLLSISQQDWSQVRKLSFLSNIPAIPNSEGILDFPGGGMFVTLGAGFIGIISYYVYNRRKK